MSGQWLTFLTIFICPNEYFITKMLFQLSNHPADREIDLRKQEEINPFLT